MNYPLSIENDHLKAQVFPAYGSKVISVIDKADHFDLLFSYPRELPTAPHYDIDYGEGWYAGWDECFPGIGKGAYPLHPYTQVPVPDHGELWGLPTTVQPSPDGIQSRWHGIRFGYQLKRNLRLVGPTLEAQYELENLTPFDFHYVWALHSLMAMTIPVEFDFQGDAAWRLSHGSAGSNQPFNWPTLADRDDVSRPSALPAGGSWKLFSQAPIDRPLTVRYPTRNRRLTISYGSESGIAAYWGIWINTGGWAGHHHFAVEPTSGRFDHLADAIHDRSAAAVGPQGTVRWAVRWTVG